MKLSHLFFLSAFAYAAYQAKVYFSPHYAPAVSYTDVQGNSHSFSQLDKPAVVGFWIDECGYSQRMMAVLNQIRQNYPADQLDVVGFYLNSRSNSDIAAVADKEGYQVTLAAAQSTPQLIESLQSGFDIRGPGRDIYVIDKTGRIHTIKAVNGNNSPLPENQIESQVEAQVKSAING